MTPATLIRLLLLTTILYSLPAGLAAQQAPPNWGAFVQSVDVTAWQGHRFKVTAAARTECMDQLAHCAIWTRVDKADKTMGFFYNMSDRPIRDSQWKVYTITGKLDKAAQRLVFGGLYQNKGKFWFDDFHLFIETGNARWDEIPLNAQGFETDTAGLRNSWGFFRQQNFFVHSLDPEKAYEGHTSLLVDATRFVAIKVATWGNNDSVGRFVQANGVSLYVETYGQGQPLLLLHGNSSSIYSFHAQIPEFARQYRVIAVDTRGQGRSSEDGRKYTYDLFAEDMNALLDTLRLDSVDVLGWSDGGNTGLIMAMKYPRKVRKLAAMGANIFIDGSVVDRWVFDTLRAQQRDLQGDTTYAAANRSRLITLLLTEPRHQFDELAAIHSPVLVMAGDHDVIREPHTRLIAKHIPGATLVIFRKGTHYEPWEHPDRFNKTVLDFFARP
ncbi:MAG TPA: alpha/beta hydrolase [Puia sp.]|uniref:alpha/beta fold hydrolase n=1 Tax=Puia sp. TaxID=2045100 RepID=UPI002CDA18F8|nr:alpha/beta hydrolase [Puia sp.]HVU98640.1 alpha/beta hydrolase [Puia sp.]